MKYYDIAVVGAGSGGLVAAQTAKRHGLRVALLEKNKIGGECTHAGCIPSKTFISSARLYHRLQQTEQHGLSRLDSLPKANFAQVMEHVNSVVQSVYQNETPAHFQQLGIDVYLHPAGAHFMSEHEIAIGGETLQANHVIICTGSSPRMTLHAGAERLRALTNENFWALREQPQSILFLGGGIISAELGQCLARFGTQVTIIEQAPRIISVADEEVSAAAADALRQEGIRILTDSEVKEWHGTANGQITVTVDQLGHTQDLQAEQVFVALGRAPNVAGLQLERAEVVYSEQGIQTNPFLQTSALNIYACGDVTSSAKFSHIAYYQAEVCMENILNGNRRVNDLSVVPWAIFMEPEVAHVGLTEAEARQKHGRAIVSRINSDSIDRFVTEGEVSGFVKLIMTENEVIVGADAIGAHAGEWIQFFTLAIKQGLSLQQISETIFIYPTFSEIALKAVSRYLRAKRTFVAR